MEAELCPACGCTIIHAAYDIYDKQVAYCCESCATEEGQCTCGCCEVVEGREPPGPRE